jgi:hypothetical protein
MNDGKPIPQPWRAEIERALGNPRRGAPKRRTVKEREKRIAMRWLKARQSGEPGAVAREVSAIAEEYGIDVRAVYRDVRAGEIAAYTAEIEQRLGHRDAERQRQR